ncbi:hypothetical protein MMC13_002620 [Lambiella insularis]|nr:hypothetical protein [Lambiella insularis]
MAKDDVHHVSDFPALVTTGSRPLTILSHLSAELGLFSIYNSPRDTKLLCLQRFVRLFAFGLSTLILVLYLASLGISDTHIGIFMTLTLLGDVVISFGMTIFADGLGRRNTLMLGAALICASGTVFALTGNYWVLAAASILGIISPNGNEIGPFRAIEESTLAHLTPQDIRSDIFAWYTLLGKAGTAMGTMFCGWMVQKLQRLDGWTSTDAYRVIFTVYAVLGLVNFMIPLILSSSCELDFAKARPKTSRYHSTETTSLLSDFQPHKVQDLKHAATVKGRESIIPSLSPSSRSTLIRLCLLFALESFASGIISGSWIAYFFTTKFALHSGALGTLFFTTNIISSASILLAAPVAKRIGVIKTMVFTHLPSAVFLALVPLTNSVGLSMMFLVLRSCTMSMDQAPREAFLTAVVLPTERTAIMGVLNVVKTLSQSAGPSVTGALAEKDLLWVCFVAAGTLKVSYDLGLLNMFVGFQAREEQEREQGLDENDVKHSTRRERIMSSEVDIGDRV